MKFIRLTLAIFCIFYISQAFAINKGGLGEFLLAEPPPASAQIVEVGFFPVAVHSIDESTSTSKIDFYMWMRWKGERDPTKHVTFMNSVNKWGMTKTILYESPVTLDDGTKYQFMRVEGTFQETFSLATFGSMPFSVELDIKGSGGLARCSWAQPAPAGCLANA